MPDPGHDRPFGWDRWAGIFAAHRAPAYAALARACAADPDVAGPGRPLVLLAAVRRAALDGRATDPFGGDPVALRADVRALREEIDDARARDLVRFTEPLRMADLLPGLLLVAARDPGRPLRIVDLGSCAGLHLVPERYEIRYPTGGWLPAAACTVLSSDLEVPPALLDRDLPIEDRVGVDLAPVDPADPRSLDTLRSFTWPGDPARETRLRDALTAVAVGPPPVLRADVVDVLPDLLADRVGPDATTVVIDSALSGHLDGRRSVVLGRVLDRFSARGPVALVSRGRAAAGGSGLPARVGVLHLSHRWRVEYAHTDLLSERTRWVAGLSDPRPRAAAR